MTRKSDAVRIAEIESHDKLVQEIMGLIKNPLVLSVTLCLIVERLKADKGFWTEIKTDAIEAALFATPIITAAYNSGFAGKVVDAAGSVASKTVDTVGKAAPALALL